MVFVFIGWVILSIAVAYKGSSKNIGVITSFLISFIFSPLIGLLFVVVSSPKRKVKKMDKNVVEITDKAIQKYNNEEYLEALEILKKALPFDPNEKRTHFNLSSLYSLTKQKEKSFFHLEKAIELGYKNFANISIHLDFKWLREQSEFNYFINNGYRLKDPQREKKSYLDKLKKMVELKTSGLISESEFEDQKRKILSQINNITY